MNSNACPFFSVVIPVYNSEQYLNECLSSIFKQSCKDFEIVLVDDGSKDQSGKICDNWKLKYPKKIQVIHQKNTGVYIAKRNGIKASNGKFIYVMDNDDLIISQKAFETIKHQIIDNGCDLVIFNSTDNIKTKHLLCNLPFTDGEIFEGKKLTKIYEEFLKTKNLHHIWMMVFNRNLFDWDFKYAENFPMLRDGPSLILPIISNANKVIYLKDIFYYWRIQNQNSASKHYDIISFYNSIQFLHTQVIKYSKLWKYKSKNTDKLVKTNYVMDICIAAIKVRSISSVASVSRTEYLQMLSNDKMFRAEYTLDNLEFYRKFIAFLLYHRQYWIINLISSLVGMIKRR